jgi:metal-responsive CopG/Arc/MetJ family transcriptional regulator
MATTKVAITIEVDLVKQLDRLVADRIYPNRSQAIQEAIRDKLDRLSHRRLAME